MKPLYDASFFTIDTGDLSAGVRGTSISILKRGAKTQLEVIDSYAETEAKRGVVVHYKDPKTKQVVEATLKPENRIIFNQGETNTVINQVFKTDEILTDDFKRQNTQKDIVFMDHLQKTTGISKNLADKVSGELAVTLPK